MTDEPDDLVESDEVGEASERHASWTELFFDLVAVVGVGQLAHLLHGSPGLTEIGLYALMFLAFWTVWMSFTMYANVLGVGARTTSMVFAMFGMAVMAASVTGVHHGEHGDHANAFALAYVLTRLLASWAWKRRDALRVAVDWPIAQAGIGVVPWVVSLWTHGTWQFVLWGLGIAIDLAITLAMPRQSLIRDAMDRADRMVARAARPPRRHPERTGRGVARREARYQEIVRLVTNPLVAGADAAHLSERLGLFVIIVLGEGVISAVQAASEVEWDRALLGVSLAAFALLVSLWLVSIYGAGAAVPQLAAREFGIRVTLVWHCLSTGLIAAMAAGLGGLVEHPHGPASTAVRWLLCGAAAGYFALSALGGMATGLPMRWLLGWGLPGVAVPLLVGLFGAPLHPAGVVGLVALVGAWHANYMFRRRRARAAESASEVESTGRP